MEALPGFDAIFAPDLSDEERRRIEAAANATSPMGATETPATALPGTGTLADGQTNTNTAKDPDKPIVEPGSQTSFGQSDAGVLADQNKQQTDALTTQNDLLMKQIAQQTLNFQTQQDAILKAQKAATDAISSGFLTLSQQQQAALQAADQLRKNTGQAERKPNYSVSLKANAAKNAGGISSTALTGPGGVAPGTLPLGKTSLLGGS